MKAPHGKSREDQSTTRWRRLDPRMLLVHPVNELVRFLPALVVVFVLGSSGDDGGTWWHVLAVAVPIALGLLRFLTTRFRITATQLELRKGLVSRTVLTTPLDRVRSIELTASPIHRLLGLTRVDIGTGSATGRGGGERLLLDSLSLGEARSLRASLLHRAEEPVGRPTDAGADRGESQSVSGGLPASVVKPPADTVLLRFDAGWARYAPFTTAGFVIALALVGASSQFSGQLIGSAADRLDIGRAATVPIWTAVVVALVLFLVVTSVFAVLGYLLTNWDFRLSRDASGRSYHVVRGLLTSRETSLETARLRGVEVHEPLGLRLAGGASLGVVATGLRRRESGTGPLAPAAPRPVVLGVAAEVLGQAGLLTAALVRHGRLATRRRFTRALGVGALLAGGWCAAVLLTGWDRMLLGLAVLPLVVAALLAVDRARRLGHTLTGDFLVGRSGSLSGRTDVLARAGIIGWNLEQSWFQRRLGLVTLVATTAAGRQGYRVPDVPEPLAVALADAATPGLLTPFLVEAAQTDPATAPRRRKLAAQ